jgi:hypothetical protein
MIRDTSSSLSLSVVLAPLVPLSFKERGRKLKEGASPPSLKLLPPFPSQGKGIKGIGSGLPKSGTDYQAECH